ncbi:hypothetical protein [Enterovibrio norvegicus]|uniref:hypothetical protein n=1 Tax=Enterovibrio norvegicus TaxID=188144 RepID=UPI0024B17930|nr:hypothetical protein [Enterovibrio norvegicus]
MIASVAINEHIFNLLIKKGLDHFSVTDLRDELMNENQDLGDGSEARKFVYRQLLRLVEKGYLEKTSRTSGKMAYRKTELFFKTTFKPRLSRKKISKASREELSSENAFSAILKSELARYEAELSITLREMDKYQSLMSSYPEQAEFISKFFVDARERAKDLQGDIEAVNNLVMHYPGVSSC